MSQPQSVELGLLELRERAYQVGGTVDLVSRSDQSCQHIQKSLTVENIPFEVFSPFSATFAEVRKVQVNYFLEHWGEIRSSDAMRNVWRQIRNGRHPGFEEGPWLMSNYTIRCSRRQSVAFHCPPPGVQST